MSTNTQAANADTSRTLIPGAYERRPAASRQLGTMGAPIVVLLDSPLEHPTMDASTIADRRREGGGTVRRRTDRGRR